MVVYNGANGVYSSVGRGTFLTGNGSRRITSSIQTTGTKLADKIYPATPKTSSSAAKKSTTTVSKKAASVAVKSVANSTKSKSAKTYATVAASVTPVVSNEEQKKKERDAFDNAVADALIKEFSLASKVDSAKLKNLSGQEKLKYICDLVTENEKNENTESAVIKSFDNIYDYFANENSVNDAKKIMMHKIYYAKGDYIPTYNPEKFKYDSVRNQDLYEGAFPYGHVTIEKHTTPTMGQKLLETGIKSFAGTITGFGWLSILEQFGEKAKLPAYYEYNPGAILQNGDIQIYYSGDISGGYGKYYYYREDELLYIANDGKGLYEKGVNFDQYASNRNQDTEDLINDGTSIIFDVLFDMLFGR